MTSERGGLLKTHAESFARRLQSRLRSLRDSEDSWDVSNVNSSSDEVYYDVDSPLASPEEETSEPIFMNHQNCLLERSDSAGSQYFDAVEKLEDLPTPSSSPVPTLKRIPILHLKTDRLTTVPNGHTITLDADSGCSRVREIPSVELGPACKDQSVGNGCDRNCLEENGQDIGRETEQETDSCTEIGPSVVNRCEASVVEVDVIMREGGISENDEGASDSTQNSFCVFCDIEQIKSSFSNNTEDTLHEGHLMNGECENGKIETQEEKVSDQVPLQLEEKEESVSLTDLLQVLKQDIARETQQNKVDLELKKEHSDNSNLPPCPRIEIQEDSSSTVVAKEEITVEEFDIETKRKNFRRCSSLKSGKTPPSTPGRKKFVRFADVLGLDLADVKTFLDEVPTIPKSAYEDLHGIDLTPSPGVEPSPFSKITVIAHQLDKVLVPLFQQPGGMPNFLDRIRANNVCLENAVVSDMTLFAITGLVRVRNIDFHKSVHIRYTINGWKTYSDLQARYIPNSCDGFSDKFTFNLYAHTLNAGQRLEFAIRFQAAGMQYWDSNGGHNYIFECTSRGPPRTYLDSSTSIPQSPIETWASFY